MPRVIPRAFSLLLCCLLFAGAALASSQEEEPYVGQPGKDVIWVPTPEALVEKMLDMAKVTKNDYVIDFGSGDGRNVIAAAKRGARALGVEFDATLIKVARRNAKAAGVENRGFGSRPSILPQAARRCRERRRSTPAAGGLRGSPPTRPDRGRKVLSA